MISTFTTRVHDLPFVCSDDSAVGRVVKKGEYELAEVHCISTFLKPGMTFIDGGANVGYFTILAAKIVGPEGRVESFEPDPDNQQILHQNVYNNNFTNVRVHSSALGLIPGKKHLYHSFNNTGDHRTWNDGKEQRLSTEIDVTSIDDSLSDLKRVDLLKVDVQGDEMNVLRGGQALISRSPGMLLTIEYWPYGLIMNGSNPTEFADFLLQNNFIITVIQPQDARLIPIGKKELLSIFPHDADQVCNLLCIKGS